MFQINDDLSIYVTRGDIVAFHVTAEKDGVRYQFKPGDVVRIKVFVKKDAESVVLQKDFPVTVITNKVKIYLTENDTKFGDVISKPRDYWYEVELNPYDDPQTIIGYDEDGPKVFRLFPEGDDVPEYVPDITPDDIPIVDAELDLTSARPIQNRAVARALAQIDAGYKAQTGELISNIHNTEGIIQKIVDVCKTYTDHFDEIVYGNIYTAYDENVQQVSGKWQLDCSSFQNLLIRGVTFENSRYAGKEKNVDDPLFFTRFDGYEYRLANQMAKWLYENGYTFAPAADMSNIEPGDLVFYSWPETTGEFHENAFMHIDHVAMYLQRKNDTVHQTIQYEQYTPNFFYDVTEEYMSSAVLVARLPFAMVENTGDNLVLNSEENGALNNSTNFIVGVYNLVRPMIPGKMYTCCFKGKNETSGSYFLLRTTDGKTVYSNFGETWSGEEKEYRFSFICPEGLENNARLHLSVSAGDGTTRTASAEHFCLYEGFKRVYTDRSVPVPYPIYHEFNLAADIVSDLDTTMAPSNYVLEFKDYYLLSLNIPLKTLRSGLVLLGTLGAQLSATRRVPANLVGNENSVVSHYNGFLQISGASETGEIYVGTGNSNQKYQYIMANGMIAK